MFSDLFKGLGFGNRAIGSQQASLPSAALEPDVLAIQRPEWAQAVAKAQNSLVQVYSASGSPIGCGILVGVDRMLVPAHVVENGCPSHFNIQFMGQTECVCYFAKFPFIQFLEVNVEYDYCLVQLGTGTDRFTEGMYPGQCMGMPTLRCKHYEGQFLFAHIDEFGQYRMSIGDPCSGRQVSNRYCAYSQTEAGSSGGAYFDQTGALFAMHSGRMKASCGYSKGERSAVYIQDFMETSPYARLQVCTPICPPNQPVVCLSELPLPSVCIDYEKGRASISGEFRSGEHSCKYWELHPKNNRGAGPRGIRVTITKAQATGAAKKKQPRISKTNCFDRSFWLSPNPHDVAGYKGSEKQKLYETAAKAFFQRYLDESKEGPFSFWCYGQQFHAR